MNNLYRCIKINQSYSHLNNRLDVIKDLDLSIEQGSSLCLVGPSGCGKTTLLNILAGLNLPTSGEIEFRGSSFSSLGSDGRAALRNKEIGFVYQFHHLLPEFSALENIALPMQMSGMDKKNALEKSEILLEKVNLDSKKDNRPGELSGGERQRVAIARSLSNSPSCLLMDEPTGNLDKSNAQIITNLVLELVKEEGATLIIATHDMALAERLDAKLNLELR